MYTLLIIISIIMFASSLAFSLSPHRSAFFTSSVSSPSAMMKDTSSPIMLLTLPW